MKRTCCRLSSKEYVTSHSPRKCLFWNAGAAVQVAVDCSLATARSRPLTSPTFALPTCDACASVTSSRRESCSLHSTAKKNMSRRYFYQSLSLEIISSLFQDINNTLLSGRTFFCAQSRDKQNNKLRAAQNDSKKIYPDFFQQQHISNPEKRRGIKQ